MVLSQGSGAYQLLGFGAGIAGTICNIYYVYFPSRLEETTLSSRIWLRKYLKIGHETQNSWIFTKGNLLAFVLFVSPIPTFRRIVKHKSTENFSGLPYIYSLLNCLICFWYGLPCVSHGVILVATVNSIGAIFQLVYVIIFIVNAEQTRKLKMSALLVGVLGIFGLVVYISFNFFDPQTRQLFVGCLSVISLIAMFASPLFIINLVIRTQSVEFMPFYLSLSTFLMSIAFFAYGMLEYDLFIYIPNGIGAILGAVQLVLYAFYSRASREEDVRRPLLV